MAYKLTPDALEGRQETAKIVAEELRIADSLVLYVTTVSTARGGRVKAVMTDNYVDLNLLSEEIFQVILKLRHVFGASLVVRALTAVNNKLIDRVKETLAA